MLVVGLSPLLLLAVGLGLVCYVVGWCVYTFYFHPLSKYPGPKLAAITQVWLAYVWLSGRYPTIIHNAHRKYGGVVRVSPNELSFDTVQAHRDIYSTPSRSKKPFIKDATFYNNGDVRVLFYEIDAVEHAWQRKLLATGFSNAAMRSQEHLIHRYVDLFVQKMGHSSVMSRGKGVNVTETIMWLGFDIMGEMTFSESFGCLESGQPHFWVSLMRDGAHAAILPAFSARMPLLRMILPYMITKSAIENRDKHYEYTLKTVRRRIQLQNQEAYGESSDLFGPMVASGKLDEAQLVSMAQALVIAGADTVSHALTGALYFLCANPACLEQLQHEIRGLGSYDELTGLRLATLPYLNAVLEETMRAFPPIAFGLPRVSPGDIVDGHFIPEGATVSAPHWAIMHNEAEWDDPYAFKPERWLRPNSESLPKGLAFSSGPRACLGVSQAWLEIRIALAKLVYTYDMRFARDHGDWINEARMYMMWQEAPLMVEFGERKV